MPNESQAMEILEKALGLCEAEEASVSLGGGANASTRFADNVITQNVAKDTRSFGVSCSYGQQHGSASTNDLSDDSIRAAVARAQEAARLSPPDPEHMPLVTLEERGEYPKVEAYDEATAAFSPQERAEAIAAAARESQARGLRLSGAFANGGGFHALANSAGVRAFHKSTHAQLHATVLGDDGSGWAQAHSNRVGDIDCAAVGGDALRIAENAQKPTDAKPGRYTVIMRPAAVQELIPYYVICDAKATDEGRTCLRDKLGKKIVGENITLRSDPADPRCPASPFQGNGMASPALPWIDKGVLTNRATSRYWAKEKGRKATGYPANVILDSGDKTDEELVASTERGIFIVRFWYIRVVDPMTSLLTGMTRDGLFLIEDGKITRPIRQLRFNDNVLDILNRVEEIGRPERVGGALVPTLKVRDFNFTSGTKF